MSKERTVFVQKRKGKKMADEWNLGSGIQIVCNSAMKKLRYAGHQLEERERTIINLDSYEVTALIWALSEYMERRASDD